MSAIEFDRPAFKIEDLWTDSRWRGVTIQVIAIAGLFAFLAFIVNNTLSNLEALGLEPGYGFLSEPSSYDINQTLIEYDSRSSHGRATLVGLLNTGLVAFCGIIAATLLGFTVGVLRLSGNWLISRIMYCYVEFTRNVPLLLQILLWHGLVVHSLPRPKDAHEPLTGIFLSNRGFSLPSPVFEDGSFLILLALIVAVVGSFVFSRYAKRVQEQTGKHYPVLTINFGMIVLLPLLAYLVSGMPVSLDWPELRGFNFAGGMTVTPEFVALWFALSIYTASFISENVRAGIQAISHGQTEAAYALGIRPNWTMRLVILPQALRVIIPPLISQYLNLTKNSSLAIAVGYMDVVATIGGITLNQTGRALECMSIVLAIYLSFSLIISMIMNWYNKRVALVER
jgi:general L-amino acid transport system permease protein